MQEEKKVAPSMREYLHKKLCKLFLHTFMTQPNIIKDLVVKHIEIPENSVTLVEEKAKVDENDNVIYSLFKLLIFEYDFTIRLDKRIEQPREVEVPKVVNKPKKWYQRTPDKMIVIEKKPSSEKPLVHWFVSSID